MTEIKPANPLEILSYIISKQIDDHQIVYVGTGLPMVAAILAKRTHAPNITMVYESGAQNPMEGDMPWSVGGPFTWRKAPLIQEMSYSFGQCYNGYVDIGFLGFAQIDMYGNVNTTLIGDYHNYKARLTGSGGNNDLSSLTENMVLVGLQSPDKFVEKVDFITSPGYLTGGNARKEAGLLGNGPQAVISQVAVYDFHPETKKMKVKSLHPGVSFELCQAACGFKLDKPEGDIPVTSMPDKNVLQILREQVDPRGVFTSIPGM